MTNTIVDRDSYKAYADAFAIFARYQAEGERSTVAAEHDTLYAGPNPAIVSAEDIAALETLGWHVDEDYECFIHFV